MNLPELIESYGYWAVLAGTLLDGESVLLLAGFAAHRGYLQLQDVIGVAIIGSFLGDLKRYEEILLAVLAVAGLAYWWYSRRRV